MPLPDKQRAVPLCFDLLCYGWRDRWEGLLFVCPGDAVPERRPPAEERRASGRTHGIARVEVGEEKTARPSGPTVEVWSLGTVHSEGTSARWWMVRDVVEPNVAVPAACTGVL
jgi:hypothetical protein